MMLPLSMRLPLNHGVSTITEDHAQQISSALLNFRWHPCGRPVIAALDARMRDALMGVLNRRQEVLRAAGNLDGIVAYRRRMC